MCRIMGYLEKKNNICEKSVIETMIALEKHGGPDDNGYELCRLLSNSGNDLAMGFTRLSILDISYNGHQPMCNEDKTICLMLNGEIYNAFDYKNTLSAKGYSFTSNSDTEVVLYMYMEYGIKMLEMINGMFSICIFDQNKKELYLIRDRLGVKPLYYYDSDDVFLFGSEYKTFYAHPKFKNEFNTDVLTEQLMFKFVAGENTLLKNVKNVLPGQYLKISKGGLEKIRYWKIKNDKKNKVSNYELEKALEKSVHDRLLSDVKLGIQLSGGVDSTLVLEYMSRKLTEVPIETYSIIVESESEKKYIDYATKKYNVNQHQILLKHQDFCNLLEKATWHLDTPLNHPNSIGILKMCMEAKNDGIKVLMTGEGADETFGGYAKYVSYLVRSKYPFIQKIYSKISGDKQLFNNEIDRFIATSILIHPSELTKIYPNANIDHAFEERRKIYKQADGNYGDIRKALNYELETYLVDVLNRQDKMSMAHSIETRVPFLNYNLIEQIRSQKTNSYIKENLFDAIFYRGMHSSKIILKRISSKYFGRKFAYRKKDGFSLPLRTIFCSNDFRNRMEEYIIPALEKLNVINMEEVSRLWDRKEVESELEIGALWVLIALGQWASIFLGNKEKVTKFI